MVRKWLYIWRNIILFMTPWQTVLGAFGYGNALRRKLEIFSVTKFGSFWKFLAANFHIKKSKYLLTLFAFWKQCYSAKNGCLYFFGQLSVGPDLAKFHHFVKMCKSWVNFRVNLVFDKILILLWQKCGVFGKFSLLYMAKYVKII